MALKLVKVIRLNAHSTTSDEKEEVHTLPL